MNYKLTKKQAKEMLENKLLHFFGVSTHNATNEQYYRAIAMILSHDGVWGICWVFVHVLV